MNITEVAENGFCVGCGNCAFLDKANFRLNDNSVVEIVGDNKESLSRSDADAACPFSEASENEDDIAEAYYKDCDNHDPAIGYHNGIYVGWDNDESSRLRSSSGGLATFLVKQLMSRGLVDAAIVVVYDESSPSGVKYEIVRDPSRLDSARQSKYVVKNYLNVVDELENIDGKFVFVGVPCFVKSIKLLMNKKPKLKEKIAYTIAIFCGHQKTVAFSQYIGWNLGVPPSRLKSINYRVKKKGLKSYEYFYQAIDNKDKPQEGIVTSIKWMDWGVGLFKLKACDFCDDVTGETADIIFGDAWLKPYIKDYRGTNILLCRNREIENILLESAKNVLITLEPKEKETLVLSQAANYRHRKEGVFSRIAYFESKGMPYPNRRDSLFKNFVENIKRRDLYITRYEIARKSHTSFEKAKQHGDLSIFFKEMDEIVNRYVNSVTTLKVRFKSFVRRVVRLAYGYKF